MILFFVILLTCFIGLLIYFTILKRKEKDWKKKDNVDEKEYKEEDIEKLLRILGDRNKVDSYEERKDAWLRAEKGIDKEIEEYERSRKAKLAKIKSEYDRMERAAEQDYLAHLDRINKMRENENKNN